MKGMIMKLSPVNTISFSAKYSSNSTLGNNSRKYNDGLTKEQIIEHFDMQIDRIELQKQKALELEDFMQSDEVKEILAQLPENDEVVSDSLLTSHEINPINKIQPRRMKLYYLTNSYENLVKINRYDYNKNDRRTSFIQLAQNNDRDKSINKKGIIAWLKELVCILNGDE